MPLQATSVRLDDETLARIGEMAEAIDRPRAWLMAFAIKQFVAQADSPYQDPLSESPAPVKNAKKSKKKNRKKAQKNAGGEL